MHSNPLWGNTWLCSIKVVFPWLQTGNVSLVQLRTKGPRFVTRWWRGLHIYSITHVISSSFFLATCSGVSTACGILFWQLYSYKLVGLWLHFGKCCAVLSGLGQHWCFFSWWAWPFPNCPEQIVDKLFRQAMHYYAFIFMHWTCVIS